jgi:hypothetical protein
VLLLLKLIVVEAGAGPLNVTEQAVDEAPERVVGAQLKPVNLGATGGMVTVPPAVVNEIALPDGETPCTFVTVMAVDWVTVSATTAITPSEIAVPFIP